MFLYVQHCLKCYVTDVNMFSRKISAFFYCDSFHIRAQYDTVDLRHEPPAGTHLSRLWWTRCCSPSSAAAVWDSWCAARPRSLRCGEGWLFHGAESSGWGGPEVRWTWTALSPRRKSRRTNWGREKRQVLDWPVTYQSVVHCRDGTTFKELDYKTATWELYQNESMTLSTKKKKVSLFTD